MEEYLVSQEPVNEELSNQVFGMLARVVAYWLDGVLETLQDENATPEQFQSQVLSLYTSLGSVVGPGQVVDYMRSNGFSREQLGEPFYRFLFPLMDCLEEEYLPKTFSLHEIVLRLVPSTVS